MLSLRALGKDFGARAAVAAIDLDVRAGECVGLLGPNGAGKTTTVSMICGVLAPSRGQVTIDGHDVHRAPYAAKPRLGLVPQELALYDELSALENLRFAGALYGLTGAHLAERIEWALATVGLATRGRDRVGTYSGGMKRRLNLAAGLLHAPQLLLLDEPTAGVDAQSRHQILTTLRTLKAAGVAMVYTSHYLEEIEALCDRVAVIDRGTLVACGTLAELVDARGGTLETAYLSLTGHAPRDVA